MLPPCELERRYRQPGQRGRRAKIGRKRRRDRRLSLIGQLGGLKVKTFKTRSKNWVLKVLKLRLLRPQNSLKVKTSKIILGIFLKNSKNVIADFCLF